MTKNKLIMAIGLSGLTINAFGAAFQLSEHSASGLGRAFAGDAAIAENASVVARNPALMSAFTDMQFSAVGTYIMPDVSIKGQTDSDLDVDSIAPSAFVPNVYMVIPLQNNMAVGVGVNSNFGLASEFEDDYKAGQLAGETAITTANFNVNGSYEINDQFVVALGLNVVTANATMKRTFGESAYPLAAETVALSLEGDDIGFGWNLGVTYELSDAATFGFAYRSQVALNFEGEYTNDIPVAGYGGAGGATVDGTLALDLPAIAEFSGSHQLNQQWGVHYSVMWTQWSVLQKLEALDENDGVLFSKDENFSDSFRYAVGGDFQLDDKIKLRAGLAYDTTPADPDHMSISIPDTNRIWISTGGSYLINPASVIDVGMSVVRGEEQSFTESDNLGTDWDFTSNGNAIIISAQYNYSM